MPKIQELAANLRAEGRRPFAIPIGASTPLGALAFALAVAELVDQMPAPDVIVHSTSSGGTQAGLVAGCRLLALPTRVIGVSADDSSSALETQVNAIVTGVGELLQLDPAALAAGTAIEVDDRFVGGGYGIPTPASTEAIELAARREAIFLDPTYTAKAMAGFIARLRGVDAQDRDALKTKAQIMPSSRPEVNKNMVIARGAVDNISEEPLGVLEVEVSLRRGDNAPPEIRRIPVTPDPLPPGERGSFEFEYDGKRDTGFAGYTITRLFSNGTEVRFRTPPQ